MSIETISVGHFFFPVICCYSFGRNMNLQPYFGNVLRLWWWTLDCQFSYQEKSMQILQNISLYRFMFSFLMPILSVINSWWLWCLKRWFVFVCDLQRLFFSYKHTYTKTDGVFMAQSSSEMCIKFSKYFQCTWKFVWIIIFSHHT